MRLTNWHKGILFTFIAHIIWGVSAPLVKIVLDDIPPISLLFLRSLFTVIILFPIFELKLLPELKKNTLVTKKGLIYDIFPLTKPEMKDMFLAGFLGVFLNISLYFWAQTRTTVIDAWVIASSGTIFLVIYSYFFLKERLAGKVYFGVGLAFIGTLVIIGSPIFSFGKGDILGNFLMLGSTICAIASFVVLKKLITKFNPLLIVFYTFLLTLIMTTPLFIFEFIKNPFWMTSLSQVDLLIVAYLVFGSSIFAYVFSNAGLKFLPASISSTLGYSSTIIAVALSIIFLKESPTFFFLIGSGIIIAGLLLVETRHKKTT